MGTVCWTFGLSAQCVEQKIAATTILCLYTMVNGERIQKGSSYKLSDGDILSLGRSGTYKGVEFKAIIGKLSLGFPAYDSVVPNSLDQLPMVEEEERKEAKPLDRTL